MSSIPESVVDCREQILRVESEAQAVHIRSSIR
jgi:hypothetical protein